MGMWSTFFNWMFPWPDERAEVNDSGGVQTAVLELPGTATSPQQTTADSKSRNEATGPQRWWKPEGRTVIEFPRLTRPPELDRGDPRAGAALPAIETALHNPDIELPHLPKVPQQILNMVRHPDVRMAEIARILQQDQVLAATVLRRANSAGLGGVHEITSLDTALARIGLREIRALMISRSVRSVTLNTTGGKTRGAWMWRESLACGFIAAAYNQHLKIFSEDAFLVGLLHDIGRVVVLRVCHDAERTSGVTISDEAFDYLCQEYHQQLGERLAVQWELPTPITRMIGHHHDELRYEHDDANVRALIQLTDATAALLGYGPPRPFDLLGMPAAMRLHLDQDPGLISLLEALPGQIEAQMQDG